MTFYKWSQTASADATADSTINWAEGQAPSSVNDSARAMMAASAKYRDEIAGEIVTSGTSTAYAVTSYQAFDTLAHLAGQMIAFTPHVTNAATVTLNVDSLGARPLRTSPGVELLAGTIIQGTPYVAVYNGGDGVFYLRGFFGNPYNVPLGAGMDYWGSVVPNSSFAFPAGQAISRTTYATLFAIMGTAYGTGDGSTTFNLPDKTGRVSAMVEATATRLTSTYFGANSTALGATGGRESSTLLTANLPPYTPQGTMALSVSSPGFSFQINSSGSTQGGSNGVTVAIANSAIGVTSTGTGSLTGTAQGGTSTPVTTVPPMIVCNYVIRII
jgi:microcystin-dependent protein